MIATTVALAGCAGGDDDAADEAALDAAPPVEMPVGVAPDADLGGVARAESDDEPGTIDPGTIDPGTIDFGIIGRDVMIEMHVLMSTDDISRSVASITANAAALGGGIASSDIDYGDIVDGGDSSGDAREATENPGGYALLVVKVPPDAIDRLLEGLDSTGTVLSVNQSAQDVTEQLIDLDVRISNARQSVATVREFMDRTENLSELVTLEGELTRRQTELEQLEAQQRSLSERVALSTVTIEIVPTASVPVDEPDQGIGDAFGDGWDAFLAFVFAVTYVLAVVAPFVLVAGLGALVVWRIAGRRRPGGRSTNDTDDADGRGVDDTVSERETVSASPRD